MKYRLKYEYFTRYSINGKGVSKSNTEIYEKIIEETDDTKAVRTAQDLIDFEKAHGINFRRFVSFERIDQEEKTTNLNHLIK